MHKAVGGSRFKAVLLGVVVGAACGVAQANPTGPTVVNGQVRFSGDAGVLNITNSPSAIINWQGFSIRQGEITRFLQQNANSAVLNRVIGQNPSAILGSLLSNGRVFVINPNGILFGRNAVVDTQGLIASTLNIKNADFLAGKYEFAAAAGAGAIRNQGFIRSGPGGEVVLIAPSIENSGIIRADDGDLVLAAGRKVTLTSLDAAGVSFDVQAPTDSVVNLGQLIARRGTIGAFAGTLRNIGRIEASGLATDAAGNIVLTAKADLALESGSVVSASGAEGGEIRIESESGSTTVDGVVDARGAAGRGGRVDITGDEVVLKAAVDASGETGGGRVRVGGGYRGEGTLRTAARTEMAERASIDVSARGEGDGGLAVVWADGTADVRGSGNIAARGGERGGDGGTIETSGKQKLSVGGAPDASAEAGDGGLWLLDPQDMVIGGVGADVQASSVVSALQRGTDVTITTVNPELSDLGDITVESGLDSIDMLGQQARLELLAERDVIVDPLSGGINAFGGDLDLVMTAARNVNIDAPISGLNNVQVAANVGNVNIDAPISGLGSLQVTAGLGNVNIDAPISGLDSLQMTAGVDIDIRADISPSGDGSLQLGVSEGTIKVGNDAIVTLDGGDASASSVGPMLVGFQDAGFVNIVNGASWLHTGAMLAGGSGGNGTISLSGGGQLQLSAGQPLVVGADAGSTGNVLVDGGSSLLNVGGALVLARGGPGADGTVRMQNNGKALVGGAVIAGLDDPSVIADIEVDGSDSRLDVVASIFMGGAGDTELLVTNGGTVTASDAYFGVSVADFPELTPLGTAIGGIGLLEMTDGASMVLGTEGVQGGRLSIGHSAGTFGAGIVDDASVQTRGLDSGILAGWAGSTDTPLPEDDLVIRNGAFVHSLQLRVGDQGTGRISIEDTDNDPRMGTLVLVDTEFGNFSEPQFANEAGFVRASREAGSVGVIDMSGGSTLRITHFNNESGPGIQLGRNDGANGAMSVSGPGTLVEILQTSPLDPAVHGPFIQVGRDGTGSMTISDFARVVMEGPEAGINVGRGSGAVGTLTLESAAQLHINVDAPLQESYFNIARDDGSRGSMLVRDPDTLVDIAGTFAIDGSGVVVNVGRGGVGSLSVSNRALMRISAPGDQPLPGMNIGGNGSSPSGVGSVSIVDASLEILGNTPFLIVGRDGTGSLDISNDGRLYGPTFLIAAADPGGQGTITLDQGFIDLRDTASDQAAALNFNVLEGDGAALIVGFAGNGNLIMQNGSFVDIDATPILGSVSDPLDQGPGLIVGALDDSDGTVWLDSSNLDVFGDFAQVVAGRDGGGDITLSSGSGIFIDDPGASGLLGVGIGAGPFADLYIESGSSLTGADQLDIAGNLTVDGGSLSGGAAFVRDGGNVDIFFGDWTATDTVTVGVSGSGTVAVDGGSWDADDVVVGDQGVLDVSFGDISVRDLTLLGGVLDGPGDIAVSGTLTLQDTILRGTGILELASGGVLSQSSTTLLDGRTLVNHSASSDNLLRGTIDVAQGAIGALRNFGKLRFGFADVRFTRFDNASGGTVILDGSDLHVAGDLNNRGGLRLIGDVETNSTLTVTGGLTNTGTIQSDGDPIATNRLVARLSNSGVVEATGANLDLVGQVSNSGVVKASGANLDVENSGSTFIHRAGVLQATDAQQLSISGGTLRLLGGRISELRGGDVNLSGVNSEFGGGDTIIDSEISLSNASFSGGSVTVVSSPTSRGVLTASGDTVFGSGFVFNLSGGDLFVDNGRLESGSELNLNHGVLSLAGTLEVLGTLNLPGDADILGTGTILHRGGLFKTGSGTSIVDVPLNSVGDISVGGGTLMLAALNQGGGRTRVAGGAVLAVEDGLLMRGGTLGGNGLIEGNVFNQGGVVSAGASPGILFIDGDYRQGRDGELLVELAGREPGQFDVLAVSGTAFLDGTLTVRFDVPSFFAAPGDIFPIIFASDLALLGGPQGFATLDAQLGYEFDRSLAVLGERFQLVVTRTPLEAVLSQALGEEATNQVLATLNADSVQALLEQEQRAEDEEEDEEDLLLAEVDEGDDGGGERTVGICQ